MVFNFSKPSSAGLQLVKSVASGGKFYWLPPEKENNGLANVNKSPNLLGFGHKMHLLALLAPFRPKSQISLPLLLQMNMNPK